MAALISINIVKQQQSRSLFHLRTLPKNGITRSYKSPLILHQETMIIWSIFSLSRPLFSTRFLWNTLDFSRLLTFWRGAFINVLIVYQWPLTLSTQQVWADDRSNISRGKKIKKVIILKFGHYTWNHHEKRIPISTNMPSIGLVICEIGDNIWEFDENKSFFCNVKPIAPNVLVLSVKHPRIVV